MTEQAALKPTQTLDAVVMLSHGYMKSRIPGKPSCSGAPARIVEVGPHAGLGECRCGMRLWLNHSGGYRLATPEELAWKIVPQLACVPRWVVYN